MQFPVGPEDVKIVQGMSGKGLQVQCSCGTVNWNHLQMPESIWSCRNCGQVLSDYFPGLAAKVLAQQKPEGEPTAQPAKP